MLFTDKIPGILDINGLPKYAGNSANILKRVVSGNRQFLEYINGVNGDDGFLFGGGDSGMYFQPRLTLAPAGRACVLNRDFSFNRFIPQLDALTWKFAVRVDNSTWIFSASTGECIKLNIDTGVTDSTFATNAGAGFAGACRFFKRVGDYIYMSGANFSWAGTTRPARFFRIGLDGLYDNSFVCGRTSEVSAFCALSNGKFVIAQTYQVQELDRLNANGSLDTAWTITQAGPYARSILTKSDGTIVVVGDFAVVSGQAKQHICAIDPYSTTGTVLSDYGVGISNFSAGNTRAYDAIECDDGDIIAAGYFPFQEGLNNQVSVCRIRKDGSMNPFFKLRGTDYGTNNSCNISWAKPITINGRKLIFLRCSSYPGYVNGVKCQTSILIDYNGRVQY